MVKIQVFFLVIILSTEICPSIIPLERYAQSSVIVDKTLFFFGGSLLLSPINQILSLDVSKPFNTLDPPFEILNVTTPVRSSFATTFFSPLKNVIYLFGGIMRNGSNTKIDDDRSNLYSFNLETYKWSIPQTNETAPGRRIQMNGVINNKTGKFYVFGGFSGKNNTALGDMNIFDTISSTWLKGSTKGSPPSLIGYTATLLSNRTIVFIGGKELYLNKLRDINQLALYDTEVDQWTSMIARGITLENRYSHSAVLTPDERIIIFGGNTNDLTIPVLNQLAVLDTKVNPYEWSVPTPAPPSSLTISLHSATLVGNYMFVNFGKTYMKDKCQNPLPYFYILDIRNFAWVTQYEPEQLEQPGQLERPKQPKPPGQHPQTPNNSKQIGIIIGVCLGLGLGVGIVAGLLCYKYYKKQRVNRYARQAEQCVSYN
ncbi:unnamed protein product [Rhizophagus irregularis]|uniref:Galactose oxidase n=1 Tax=Rhizophagus irregularis TaxID=588596 RepID=A0A2N1NHI0_9GLOM|nr:galactose oxidase [Rhizophagus irregularis]PKK79148.1 galactose oxidase [Rhizophagus irregularis]CAB4376493.1 unnamed protein product [Rhizophagus irregularis]CAB5369798.1 unnamed protein product [Rhizophagus irregularis]